jgi:cytochrome c-type biogenesis protein CcmE
MQHSRTKFLIGGLIVFAAVAYLAYAGFKSGSSYYLTVDSFMVEPQYRDQHVRLRGKVGQDKLVIDAQNMKADFHLLGEDKSIDLPVSYHGAVPDLFKAGADVVVEGKLGPDGIFKADKVLTKCASKYDAKPASPEKPS